jgi:hypothetical protein
MEKRGKNVIGSGRGEGRDERFKRYKIGGEEKCKMVCVVEKNRKHVEN